jgi:hypothetical protein
MAYFPHAFQKMLVGTNTTNTIFYDGDDTSGTDGTVTTLSLAAGQIGIISKKNNCIADLDATPTYAKYPLIYLAQGSFKSSDTLGSSLHGGYQETVKTKGINPKYVSAFYKTAPATPVNQVLQVTADGCELECNKTYWLRVDVKGSPTLRFLTHNAYLTVDGFTGCCNADEDPIDPNVVLLQWADQLNASPLMSPFILSKVWNNVVAIAPITATATADAYVTVSDRTGIAAGQRVVFIPTTASSATTSSISGQTFTVGTATNTIFSVGQVLTGTGVATGTKIISHVSGGGGTNSVFLVDISQTVASATISSVSPVTCYVDSTYVAATGAGDVALVVATNLYTSSLTTSIDVITTTTPTIPIAFYGVITTAGYTAVTSSVDDIDSFIEIVGAYVSTSFADCSFQPSDHYEQEPVKTYASIVDESGDPCTTSCFTATEVTTAYQGKGIGETLVKELILAKSYLQEDYTNDVRMREVLDDTVLTELSRSTRYHVYYILHSIPRKSNPSGMMDNDQYLVKLVLNAAGYANANTAKFETWMNALLTSAGNNVQLVVEA